MTAKHWLPAEIDSMCRGIVSARNAFLRNGILKSQLFEQVKGKDRLQEANRPSIARQKLSRTHPLSQHSGGLFAGCQKHFSRRGSLGLDLADIDPFRVNAYSVGVKPA